MNSPFAFVAHVAFWVVSTREQLREWATRLDPVDPGSMAEGMTGEEYAALQARFPAYGEVEVVTVDGEVYQYFGDGEHVKELTPEQAKRLVARIEKKGVVDLSFWVHVRTQYGSEAYIRNGVEAQMAQIERDAYRGGRGYDSPEAYIGANIWKAM